jgi:hypothetical protein
MGTQRFNLNDKRKVMDCRLCARVCVCVKEKYWMFVDDKKNPGMQLNEIGSVEF